MCTVSSACTGVPGQQQAPLDVRTSEGQAERPAHHPDILTMAPQGPPRITTQVYQVSIPRIRRREFLYEVTYLIDLSCMFSAAHLESSCAACRFADADAMSLSRVRFSCGRAVTGGVTTTTATATDTPIPSGHYPSPALQVKTACCQCSGSVSVWASRIR